jgi:UDP-glucose 4-epimerase
MRILVTGGGGFIGTHLTRALLKQGDEAVVFDLAPETAMPEDLRGRTTYVRGDCASEIDLYRVMASQNVEGVFHLGALMGGACEPNPPHAFQVNFRSTQVLLDACVTLGVKRFFFMSSIAVYDPAQPEPVPDDGIKNPPNIYGQTKLAGEHLMRWYTDTYGLDTRGVRPTWVWGPGRVNGLTALYTTAMINNIAAGGRVHIENPEERGDWLYIHDCVKAMMLLWNAKDPGRRVYTLCGSVHTLREVAEIAADYCKNTMVTFADKVLPPALYAVRFDDSAARRDLQWTPEYPIHDAVKDHIAAIRGERR